MRFIKKLIVLVLLFAVLVTAGFCYICISFPLLHPTEVKKYCAEYSLEPSLVYAIIKTESNFSPEVESHVGARGLMQLMPETIDWAVENIPIKPFSYADINKPDMNIHIGCWVLRFLLDAFDNDEALSIAAYNAGIGTVNTWLADETVSRDGENLHNIPYGETRLYVRKVFLYKAVYDILFRTGFYEL